MVTVTPPLEMALVTPPADAFVTDSADFAAPVVGFDVEIYRAATELIAKIHDQISAIDAMSASDVAVAPLALADSVSVGKWALQTDARSSVDGGGSGTGCGNSGGGGGDGGSGIATAEPAAMRQRK